MIKRTANRSGYFERIRHRADLFTDPSRRQQDNFKIIY